MHRQNIASRRYACSSLGLYLEIPGYICTLHCLLRSAPCWIMESSIPLHPWLAATWRGVKPSWR